MSDYPCQLPSAKLQRDPYGVHTVADLEASNTILRKYKHVYEAAQSITCATCHKSLEPKIFKAHLTRCSQQKQRGDFTCRVQTL